MELIIMCTISKHLVKGVSRWPELNSALLTRIKLLQLGFLCFYKGSILPESKTQLIEVKMLWRKCFELIVGNLQCQVIRSALIFIFPELSDKCLKNVQNLPSEPSLTIVSNKQKFSENNLFLIYSNKERKKRYYCQFILDLVP